MRLTNSMRDAFIRSAMNDVPQVDYNEQARKLVLPLIEKEFTEAFPDVDFKKLRDGGWLEQSWLSTPTGLSNITYHGSRQVAERARDTVRAELDMLGRASKEQSKNRDELEYKLRAVAYSVTTREALLKALPEFEKYLPEATDAVAKNLPAVANLVADFAKAGWPKGKPSEAAQP